MILSSIFYDSSTIEGIVRLDSWHYRNYVKSIHWGKIRKSKNNIRGRSTGGSISGYFNCCPSFLFSLEN